MTHILYHKKIKKSSKKGVFTIKNSVKKRGRPTIGDSPKAGSLHLRITFDELEKINAVAVALGVPRTSAIMLAVDELRGVIFLFTHWPKKFLDFFKKCIDNVPNL